MRPWGVKGLGIHLGFNKVPLIEGSRHVVGFPFHKDPNKVLGCWGLARGSRCPKP